jgi:hypothetical protein
MNWEPIFESLKTFFGNDPTMVLLLTVAFFFLKTIWPQPQPASQQILDGYLGRIREALRLGNRAGAEELAAEGIAKATDAVAKEVEPQVASPLSFLTGILGNQTLMPLLMVGGLFLVMMLGNGGCQKKANAIPYEPPTETAVENVTDASPGQFMDRVAAGVQPADLRFCSITVPARPWAWTEPAADRDAWAWADRDAGQLGDPDRRGLGDQDTGTGNPVDGPGVSHVGAGVCSAGVCSGPYRSASGRVAVTAARPVAQVDRGRFVRGPPVRNAARLVARPFRWLRLPGRPFARLFGRR